MKIAMWSGPRNLSTAMMYAFGNRPDFAVWDEPFYAAYLRHSGADHPMRDEIIAAHEGDPDMIAAMCSGSIPDEKPNFYMKHMGLHMLEGFPMDWAKDCINIHLIRHPARVVASYGAKRDEVTLDDIGFRQQVEVFDKVGGVVIDSHDIRDDPAGMLKKLCAIIDLPFDPAMLTWPAGGHKSDGIWARHWYGAVHRSTGFAGAEGPLPVLSGHDAKLVSAALPFYEKMQTQAI
ncbi:HAD family hydrolase [Octadecabacter sp. R77987]|uniref:sulfotransferase-like domain-containing protein n=1 Tax=Octadecabacter sp. R77987 TaxID=3093874 RepID=UPI00366D6EF3